MTLKTLLAAAALLVVGLPLALVVTAGVVIKCLDRTNGVLVVDGRRREYLLHVPRKYDRARPTALVISLHPASTWPAYEMHLSRWNAVADANGFIVVYPAGTGFVVKSWRVEGAATPERVPDVRFISELIDTLQARYSIDPARIYVDGMSNGGAMACVLACALPHRVAAIGAVSASQSFPSGACVNPEPVPMIAFHGTGDRIVPYAGGPGPFDPVAMPAVGAWVADWARRNGCTAAAVDSIVAANVTRREYDGDAQVVLYTLKGEGHQWPGGMAVPSWMAGPYNGSIDATQLMWRFFRAHPLRATAGADRR